MRRTVRGRPKARLWAVPEDEAGTSLVDFLFARLAASGPPTPVSRSFIRRVIVAGGVRVDGSTVRRPGRRLEAGMRVGTSCQTAPPSGDAGLPLAIRILFDDGILLAVEKPRGIPTVPTADPRRPSLVSLLEAQLAGQGRPCRLAVHQRLDAETSGIVLFATDDRANVSLAKQIAGHSVVKRYLALVARPGRSVPATFTIDLPLGQAENGPAGRMGVREEDGREASTGFSILERFRDALLIEARPATGRKHQIRVHLAACGMPILGDSLHGTIATRRRAPILMLHAAGLELVHPITAKPLRLTSEMPGEFEARLRLERAKG